MQELEPVTDEGRMLALVAYVGPFTGLPLFLIPLVMRKDAFSVFHAKHAAEAYGWIFLLSIGYFVITMVTCGVGGILFPMILLPLIPSVHGVVLALNNDWSRPLGCFGLGESMLSGVKAQIP